MLQTIVFWY